MGQCIQVTVNPKTFVPFISACAVSVQLGFLDVGSLAKATPPPGLLEIPGVKKRTYTETQMYFSTYQENLDKMMMFSQ